MHSGKKIQFPPSSVEALEALEDPGLSGRKRVKLAGEFDTRDKEGCNKKASTMTMYRIDLRKIPGMDLTTVVPLCKTIRRMNPSVQCSYSETSGFEERGLWLHIVSPFSCGAKELVQSALANLVSQMQVLEGAFDFENR